MDDKARSRLLDAQAALIGAVLKDGAIAGEAFAAVPDGDFTAPAMLELWQGCRALFLEGKPVDPVLLASRLGEGRKETIVDCLALAPSAALWKAYAEQLRRDAALERIRALDRQAAAARLEKKRAREAAARARETPEHRARRLARRAAYRAAHREEERARSAHYNAAHRQERRDYQKAYDAAHREEINARRREKYAAHREEINARRREKCAAKRAAEKRKEGNNGREI